MERYNLLKKTDEVRKSIEREVPLSNNLKNKKSSSNENIKIRAFRIQGNQFIQFEMIISNTKTTINNQVFAYKSIDKIFDSRMY